MKKATDINWNELHENLKVEVERVGFAYIADRPLSTHPDDWFLRVVLGYREVGGRKEYATWVYNATLGKTGGLGSGHYMMNDMHESNHDFLTRT